MRIQQFTHNYIECYAKLCFDTKRTNNDDDDDDTWKIRQSNTSNEKKEKQVHLWINVISSASADKLFAIFF